MAEYDLPYGKTHLHFSLPDSLSVQLLAPRDVAGAVDEMAAVGQALDAPLGRSLAELWRGALRVADRPASTPQGPSVAIAINDKTRPVPHKYLLPPLLALAGGAGHPA